MRLLIADDHAIVRRGLRSLIETQHDLEVVGEAADGLEIIRLAGLRKPDIVILDIGLPKLNGIDVAARLQKLDPQPWVIILTMHTDESYMLRALASAPAMSIFSCSC